MVFKRRDRRSYWRIAFELFFPKGGWTRAYHYVRHRLNRLPDPPHRIARGIFAGVLTSFTPFFGLHFVIAAILSKLIRGNILAGLLATFFGNPFTFPFIAASSMTTGRWILGLTGEGAVHGSVGEQFLGAWQDLKHNSWALFTDDNVEWGHLNQFMYEVFWPYLVGGIFPGLIAAFAIYFLTVPVIAHYKIHRSKRLKKKFEQIRRKKAQRAADAGKKAR